MHNTLATEAVGSSWSSSFRPHCDCRASTSAALSPLASVTLCSLRVCGTERLAAAFALGGMTAAARHGPAGYTPRIAPKAPETLAAAQRELSENCLPCAQSTVIVSGGWALRPVLSSVRGVPAGARVPRVGV